MISCPVIFKIISSDFFTSIACPNLRKLSQVGTGDRSEKIRTYNFKDNRTTDHRLGSNFSLEPILAGQLEEVINACIAQEQKRMMEDFNKEVN